MLDLKTKLFLSLSAVMLHFPVAAQINYSGDTYFQDFDTLESGLIYRNYTNFPTGWIITKGFYVWTTVTNGYSNNYGTYCFSSDASDPDKSIGLIVGTTGPASLGAHFRNSTGVTLTSFTLSYVTEQWAKGAVTAADQVTPFSYSLDATNLTSGRFVNVPALAMHSIHDGDGVFAALNGNDPANRQLVTSTVSGFSWLPDQDLWIRWTGVSHPFNWSHALAVDNVAFRAVPDLQISTAAPGKIQLSWPTNYNGYILRSAVTLTPTTWDTLTDIRVIGEDFTFRSTPPQTRSAIFNSKHNERINPHLCSNGR